MNDCVKCGTCTTVCPVYQITGREMFTARGRHQLLDNLARAERTEVFGEIFSKCLLCGACYDACPRGLDTPARIIAARAEFSRFTGHSFLQYLARRAIASPGLLAGLAAAGEALTRLLVPRLPEESGLRLRLSALDFAGLQPAARGYIEGLAKTRTRPGTDTAVSYFVGCLANHLQPEIGQALDSLMKGASGTLPGVPASQTCCGGAAIAAGNLAEGRRLARKNIAAFGNATTPIVTSCASCFDQLSTYPELLADDAAWRQRAMDFAGRLREFSRFLLAEGLADGPAKPAARRQRVLYHDPCHLRFRHRITAEPRQLLSGAPDLKLVELPGDAQCCGQGGLFHLAHPELSLQIRDRLLAKFSGTGAELVTTTCSGCLLQWRQGLAASHSPARVEHLAVLLARSRPTP